MGLLTIKLYNKNGKTTAVAHGENEVSLVYSAEYQEGDRFLFEVEDAPAFYWMQVDEAKGKSLVYVTGFVDYPIPFGEKRVNLSPKAFSGAKHLSWMRKAWPWEVNNYRNLALNTCDSHGAENCFPHASANVETRGESVFAALNAIDGVTVTSCHGEWPYESWGINQNPDAVFRLSFGRKVKTDRIVLYTRADYPHDNWWKSGTVIFSDGSTLKLELAKTGNAQVISFEEKTISWLELQKLIKSEEPSPFPALVQIEVYGTEADEQ